MSSELEFLLHLHVACLFNDDSPICGPEQVDSNVLLMLICHLEMSFQCQKFYIASLLELQNAL